MNTPSLKLVVKPEELRSLFPIFQKGFWIRIKTMCSIKSLLSDQWRLTNNEITQQIGTIFLDGKPVDDIDKAIITDGATLALSSAMPGLVGAVMRRDSFFASFRSSITHHENKNPSGSQDGIIKVKIFNTLMKQMGILFLKQGFWAEVDGKWSEISCQ